MTLINSLALIDKKDLSTVEMIVFDFDGVFTDNRVSIDSNGIETVTCSRSDGIGLDKLRSLDIPMYIISTEPNQVVLRRSEKLGVPCHFGVSDKSAVINEICDLHGISASTVLFVGNDVNDIPALSMVGFPIVVADAHPETHEHARYVTTAKGGYGAVREVCDLLFEALTCLRC